MVNAHRLLPHYLNASFNVKIVILLLFFDIQVISAVAVMVKTPCRNARSFTDCYKPRRTSHQRRPARTIVTRSQSHIRGDRFPRLPSEVFEMILNKMSGKHAAYRSKNSEIRWPFKQGWVEYRNVCLYRTIYSVPETLLATST